MSQLSFVVATEQSGLVELLEQSGRAQVKAVVNEDGDLLSAKQLRQKDNAAERKGADDKQHCECANDQ